ncbi:MAG: response regulator transcription factor [Bifidobacteriaceae bacterium]|nr:response regulator transcription factor [Bifidobacteriaceae bacterium]
MIRVAIAEDENLIRSALATMIGLEEDIDVVGEAASGQEALAVIAAARPDVAVLDLHLPDMDGVELMSQLAKTMTTGTVIVTSHGSAGCLRRALAAGALGFLPKTASAAALTTAIREAHAGRRYVDQRLATEAILVGDSPLTPREAEVLSLAAEGIAADEIASRASLASGTVRNYLSSCATKLGTANRHRAAIVARAKGWI